VRVAIEVGFPCYITEIKANGDSLVLPGTKATDEEANRGIGRAKRAETSANGNSNGIRRTGMKT
jgi:hypothetical protein